MRAALPISLTPEERGQLRAWRDAPDTSPRLARRARIVLAAAEGRTNRAIASNLSIDPETVALWRRRFSMNRLDGIQWDAPRSGRRPALPADLIDRIWRIPPHGARPDGSTWTTRQLAQSLGVSHMRVQRAWQAHRLGAASFGGTDPGAPTLQRVHQIDVAGVYLAPHGRAIIFRVETFFEPTV
ncbi:MAG: helix-turn-helix domain-containing protein, partial [Thermoplasmata archaeon]|nr:helix-turn-helix domain-containing protein [Thermoplasmata archaeon]